jgi:homoserine kinase type II
MVQPPNPAGIWDLPGNTTLAPLTRGGYNNHLFRVTLPDGQSPYVLRVYGNHSNPRLIEHELSILLQLARARLPFAVPAPVFTRRGELCATVHTPDGLKLMILQPMLPGENPRPGDLAQTRSVGEALARLLEALKKVDTRGMRLPPAYHELERVHPLVTEPGVVLASLGSLLDRELRAQAGPIVTRVIAQAGSVAASLPKQLIHGDVIPGNLLCDGDRVSAVLDFENCAVNPRIMDIAGALDTWLWDVLGTDALWQRVEALAGGYNRISPMTKAEAAAVPLLILLRNVNVLMHLAGRFHAGLSPFIDVESWIESLISIDAWLNVQCDTLTGKLLAAR